MSYGIKNRLICMICIAVFLSHHNGYTAEIDLNTNTELPRIVQLFSNALYRLGIYDVEVTAFPNPSIPVELIRYNAKYTDCTEVMLIRHAVLSQDTIASESEDSTAVCRITVDGKYVDFKRRRPLGSFQFWSKGFGATLRDARVAALSDLRQKVRQELKAIYYFSSPIQSVSHHEFKIQGGKMQGISKGMLFDIVHTDLDDKTKETLIGIATVANSSSDSSRLKIRRLWYPLRPNFLARERLEGLAAGQLSVRKSPVSENLGFAFEARPYAVWDWGFGLFYKRISDSRNENTYGFGFSGIAGLHFLRLDPISFSANAGIEMSILFKKDDDHQVVSTANFSIPIGFVAEWKFNRQFDLVLGAGYNVGFGSSQWDYTDNETSFPAYWKVRKPTINETGFFISSGLRFWIL